MPLLRACLLFLLATGLSAFAKADTIEFTATITEQINLSVVPIGSTYTGFIHYNGYFSTYSPVAPPPVTSFGFTYPTAPASVSDLFWVFIERYTYGSPLEAGITYIDWSAPGASFDINGPIFMIFTPDQVMPNEWGTHNWEQGTVTYTYLSDTPISPTPEPSTFVLLGTGVLGAAGAFRRRFA